jgi:hypothetical protein
VCLFLAPIFSSESALSDPEVFGVQTSRKRVGYLLDGAPRKASLRLVSDRLWSVGGLLRSPFACWTEFKKLKQWPDDECHLSRRLGPCVSDHVAKVTQLPDPKTLGARHAFTQVHSPNTYNTVALRCSLTSGEFTSVRRPVA